MKNKYSKLLPFTKYLIVFIVVLAGLLIWINHISSQDIKINSFETCAKYYPVLESYPAQCRADGVNYIQY